MQSKFHPCASKKCGLTAPQIAKIVNFWNKFAPKGTSPKVIFCYIIWLGGECVHSVFAPSHQNLPLWLKNVGLRPSKIVRMVFLV